MKVKAAKAGKERAELELSDVNLSFANAIRRYAMDQLPVFAIDVVTFYENTSVLFDEYLAHRMGLVPLKTPAKFKEDTEVLFGLDVQGPATVHSGDLKSFDAKVKVANTKIPLFQLTEGQAVRLEAKAKPGIGRNHAKFQAGLASYSEDNGKYHFKIESFGQLEVKEMLLKAGELLADKSEEFEKKLAEVAKK